MGSDVWDRVASRLVLRLSPTLFFNTPPPTPLFCCCAGWPAVENDEAGATSRRRYNLELSLLAIFVRTTRICVSHFNTHPPSSPPHFPLGGASGGEAGLGAGLKRRAIPLPKSPRSLTGALTRNGSAPVLGISPGDDPAETSPLARWGGLAR